MSYQCTRKQNPHISSTWITDHQILVMTSWFGTWGRVNESVLCDYIKWKTSPEAEKTGWMKEKTVPLFEEIYFPLLKKFSWDHLPCNSWTYIILKLWTPPPPPTPCLWHKPHYQCVSNLYKTFRCKKEIAKWPPGGHLQPHDCIKMYGSICLSTWRGWSTSFKVMISFYKPMAWFPWRALVHFLFSQLKSDKIFPTLPWV